MVEDTKVEPPQGYTIRGEACRDKCDYYGYTYTWCHKVTPSNLGNWRGSDYCSNEPSMNIFHKNFIIMSLQIFSCPENNHQAIKLRVCTINIVVK